MSCDYLSCFQTLLKNLFTLNLLLDICCPKSNSEIIVPFYLQGMYIEANVNSIWSMSSNCEICNPQLASIQNFIKQTKYPIPLHHTYILVNCVLPKPPYDLGFGHSRATMPMSSFQFPYRMSFSPFIEVVTTFCHTQSKWFFTYEMNVQHFYLFEQLLINFLCPSHKPNSTSTINKHTRSSCLMLDI
jgi:hypothetical protein